MCRSRFWPLLFLTFLVAATAFNPPQIHQDGTSIEQWHWPFAVSPLRSENLEERMRTRRIAQLLVLLVFVLMACKLAEQSPLIATATPIPSATSEPTATTLPTDTPAPTVDSAATQAALAPTLPPTQPPQTVSTTAPTEVPRPSQGNTAVLEMMSSDGAIGSTEGEYYRVDSYDESWAQIGWYQWFPTGYSGENFAISASSAWESASDKANWPEAGCGFVFSLTDKDNHMLAYLGLDGFVRIGQVTRGNYKALATQRYGKVSIPNGDAKIALAVYNKRVSFYVNNQRVANANATSLASGDIALTLLSGTNKDFGTRCQLTDIDLWVFK
jgi:hypothetical protein